MNTFDKHGGVFCGRHYSCAEMSEMFSDIPPHSVIASLLPRGAEYVALLLKCIREDSVFCPIDPASPHERIRTLIARLNPQYVVSEGKAFATGNKRAVPEGVGYVIHTSGSTGMPKGVMCQFEPLINVTGFQGASLRAKNAAWILSPGFDASLSDILSTLLSGGTLYVPEFKPTELKKLSAYFALYNIDTCDIPPALLCHMKREQYSTLRAVVCGGEAVSDELISQWGDIVHIAYGPTEAAVCSNWHPPVVPQNGPWLGNFVPGISGKISESGELWLKGNNLALGYFAQPEYTAGKFVTADNERCFKTGDLVEDVSGKLRFLGRIDRQVKVRGCLVCPEEIESVASKFVGRSFVAEDDGKIILYCQHEKDLRTVNEYLASRLPSHMLVSKIMPYAQVPRTLNQKLTMRAGGAK